MFRNSLTFKDEEQAELHKKKLKKAYERDYLNVGRMFRQFKEVYAHKCLKPFEFTTYNKNIEQVQILHISFLKNTFSSLDESQISHILRNMQNLVYDHNEKSKQFMKIIEQNELFRQKSPKNLQENILKTCIRCNQNIRKVNVQQLREYIQNEYVGILDRLIQQAKKQIQKQLFTVQQDEIFFKQVHKIFKSSQENIQFNISQITKLITTINKDINNIDSIKKFSYERTKQVELPSRQWVNNINNTFNQLMQISFKRKLPTFLQSMFNLFNSHYKKMPQKIVSVVGIQTDSYGQQEAKQYNQKLYKLKSLNFKLQNNNQWLQKEVEQKTNIIIQKEKQFKIQMESNFHQLQQQKQTNKKLVFKVNSLQKQVQSVKEQIRQKNQSLKSFKKKVSLIQKEKLQIEMENLQNTAEKQYLTEKNIFLQNQIKSIKKIQDKNNQLPFKSKSKIKSKKILSKKTIKEIKQKTINLEAKQFQNKISSQKVSVKFVEYPQSQNKLSQIGKKQQQHEKEKTSKLSQNELNLRLDFQKLNENTQDVKDSQLKQKNSQKNNQLTQKDNIQEQKENISLSNSKLITSSQRNEVKRVNEIIEQRLKQSGIIPALLSKRTDYSIGNNRGSLNSSQVKIKTYKQVDPFKIVKRGHFRSQTLLNNFKPLYSKIEEFIQQKNCLQKDPIDNEQKHKMLKQNIQDLFVKIVQQLHNCHQQCSKYSKKFLDGKIKKVINEFLVNFGYFFDSQWLKKITINLKQQSSQLNQAHLPKMKKNKTVSFFRQSIQKTIFPLKQTQQNQNKQEKNDIALKTFHQKRALQATKYYHRRSDNFKFNKTTNSSLHQNIQTIKRRPFFKSIDSEFENGNYKEQKQKCQNVQNCGQKSIEFLKLQRNSLQNQQIRIQIFTQEDFQLFINESNAYLYECNHTKTFHKNMRAKLNNFQEKSILRFYNDIESIKDQNKLFYEQIISFIRYPYQTVKNINLGISILTRMKFQNFKNFMQRILFLHKNCPQVSENKFCKHFQMFKRKIYYFKNADYLK